MSSATDRVRRRALPLVAVLAAAAPLSAVADDLSMSLAGIVANPFGDDGAAAAIATTAYQSKSKRGKSGKGKGAKNKPTTQSPSASPTVNPESFFDMVGFGTCRDAGEADYDFVEFIATTHGIFTVGQCIDACMKAAREVMPDAQLEHTLAGVVAQFDAGTVNDVCRCQYPDGVIPPVNLSGGASEGGYTCPQSATQCFGNFDTSQVVAGSETALPVGFCYKNTGYAETASPTVSPTLRPTVSQAPTDAPPTGSPTPPPSVSPTKDPSATPTASPTPGPTQSPEASPSAAPSDPIEYCFKLQGPGTCQDEDENDYDFIEMIATTHGITDVLSCIEECIGLIPGGPGLGILTGVVVGFETGTINDVCRCQYPDGVLPAINLSGGKADGTFFCPAKASQCFGKFDSVKEVATSESILPVGTCFKNICYEEPGTPVPTATPEAKPSGSPTSTPTISPTSPPTVSPTVPVESLFVEIGPGWCLESKGQGYDSIDMIASANGIATLAQCIDMCGALVEKSAVKVLTGVTAGFDDGTINDVCMCHYTDGILPAADLAGGESSGGFTCSENGNRCYGYSTATGAVTTSQGAGLERRRVEEIRALTVSDALVQHAMPLAGTCFANTAYVPP